MKQNTPCKKREAGSNLDLLVDTRPRKKFSRSNVLIGALLTAIQANLFFLDGLLEAYAIIMTVFCLDRLFNFQILKGAYASR